VHGDVDARDRSNDFVDAEGTKLRFATVCPGHYYRPCPARRVFHVHGPRLSYDFQPDDLHTAIFTPETVKKIVLMMGHSDSNVRQSALENIITLLKYGKYRCLRCPRLTFRRTFPSLHLNPKSPGLHS
jgi:hypothetical protein